MSHSECSAILLPLILEVFLYCMWKNEILKMVLESGIIGGKKVLEFLKKQLNVRSYSVLIAYVIVVHLRFSFLLDWLMGFHSGCIALLLHNVAK